MLRKCHGYSLTKGAIIQIFYHDLDKSTQGILDRTAGGIFFYKSPNQAFQFLEDKVLFQLDWSTKSKNEHHQKSVAFADERFEPWSVQPSISINTRELASPCSAFCSQGSLQVLYNLGSSGKSNNRRGGRLIVKAKSDECPKNQGWRNYPKNSATYILIENLRKRRKDLNVDAKIEVAGLLVIDAPRHESFNNIRSRGSSLCDVSILVVDITIGLQPQTIESIKLLKMKNTNLIKNHKPSVVASLNKVDRLYGWKMCPDVPIANALKLQSTNVHLEFKDKVTK
ncbi:eukaryotic translation initiation factor 5B-like protein, partial [Tanacetum coccineum]